MGSAAKVPIDLVGMSRNPVLVDEECFIAERPIDDYDDIDVMEEHRISGSAIWSCLKVATWRSDRAIQQKFYAFWGPHLVRSFQDGYINFVGSKLFRAPLFSVGY